MLIKRSLCAALCAFLLLPAVPARAAEDGDGAVTVTLSDGGVLADGQPVPKEDPSAAVYIAHDIVYYEAGHDFTYGEGTEADEHTAEEAAEHTVVHIARPGTYVLQGTLEKGQIAVDLGEDAKDDPEAVVTLVLDGADVTCTVAPAVIFYNVYECGGESADGVEPDLSGAGARVVIADGSENHISGSYVARIYKSYTLSEDGKSVTDSKKLHKYDGAFYSKMSMLVSGGPEGTGALDIAAENEGLDTEMHLTIDSGNIRIRSGNDGINANEDDVSVVTVNGGALSITVTGQTGEGDGIDSNGALIINGGTVTAQACSHSADAGLDAATGIYLNGGTVIASGSMLDPITASDQCCAVFSFPQTQTAGTAYALTDGEGHEALAFTPENDFTVLVMSAPALEADKEYSLTADGEIIPVAAGGGMGMGGGFGRGMGHGPAMPGGQDQGQPPALPDGAQPGEAPELPEGMTPGEAPELPDGEQPGEAPELPEGMDPGEAPEGAQPPEAPDSAQPQAGTPAETGDAFTLAPGLNTFTA